MYRTFSGAIKRLLLIPVGTATVEGSFSTLHRILSSERCRALQPIIKGVYDGEEGGNGIKKEGKEKEKGS
jgi:hypothetical protein